MKPKASSSQRIAPFTAFPNALIDTLMPTLKDTEWRLLCVVVRQTIGWSQRDGTRKQRDWLTQRQLIARTGRNSAALSVAIDTLVRRCLICTWDEAGNLLLTPSERRRYRGRLYFGLGPKAIDLVTPHETAAVKASILKTAVHKANTTKEIQDKRKEIRKIQNQEISPVKIHIGWTKAGEVATGRYLDPFKTATAGGARMSLPTENGLR